MIVVFDVGGHAANFAFDGGVGDREFPSGAKLSFLSGGSIFAHAFPFTHPAVYQSSHASIHADTILCVFIWKPHCVLKKGWISDLLNWFPRFLYKYLQFLGRFLQDVGGMWEATWTIPKQLLETV